MKMQQIVWIVQVEIHDFLQQIKAEPKVPVANAKKPMTIPIVMRKRPMYTASGRSMGFFVGSQ